MGFAFQVLKNRFTIVFVTALIMVGSIYSAIDIGKLEDPVFTVKTAVIATFYPGATASEVETYVTDVIERRLQEIGELDDLRSISRPGSSLIFVDLKESTPSQALPQLWDLLRRKVNDVKLELPATAQISVVQDEFSDVYGMLFAIHGKGYAPHALKAFARDLQRDLKATAGVKKVLLEGAPNRVVYINIDDEQLAHYHITMAQVLTQLTSQNILVDSGSFPAGGSQIRVNPGAGIQSIEEIEDIILLGDLLSGQKTLIRLGDMASVEIAPQEPLNESMRFNGDPAITLALTPEPGVNVVAMGDVLMEAIHNFEETLPVGVSVAPIAFQPHEVEKSVGTFIQNLIGSMAIVILVLWAFMGWQSAAITGTSLVITIGATLVVMHIGGIDLQRISIGALVLALGLLVDNAIVIVDMFLSKIKEGKSRFQAATEPITETMWPLFGATVIAILGASPVLFSKTDASEFSNSLVWVMGASLTFSWVVAMTTTPIMCWAFLGKNEEHLRHAEEEETKMAAPDGASPSLKGRLTRGFHTLLESSILHPWRTVCAGLLTLLMAGGLAMGVQVNFMPSSDRPVVFLDYWLPSDGRIAQVSQDLAVIESWLLARPEVVSTATYVGRGVPRFSVTVEPEPNDPSYGQILITVDEFDTIEKLKAEGDAWLAENFPAAEPRFRPLKLATSDKFSLETRISGPDPSVLRDIGGQIKAILNENPNVRYIRDDWRQQAKTLTPLFNQEKARRVGISRADVALAMKRANQGVLVGMFREDKEQLPMMVRRSDADHTSIAALDNLPVKGPLSLVSVPLSQVVDGYRLGWEEGRICRRNRVRTLTVQADVANRSPSEVRKQVLAAIDEVTFPPGYTLEWGGEFEEENKTVADIFTQLPKAGLLMLIIMVALFNGIKEPAVIIATLPMASLGVISALSIGDKPFGFMALIGLITLTGMIIKNGIVLLDQIRIERRRGKTLVPAVIDATKSRTLAISMAALTTVLGMATLWTDPLYDQTAAAIIGGLSCATFATLFVMPALYCLFFKNDEKSPAKTHAVAEETIHAEKY